MGLFGFDLSWITFGEALFAFLMGIIGAIVALQKWFWGRVNSNVSASMSSLVKGHESIVKRLDTVEGSMGQVREDLERMRGRMNKIETRIESLATKTDLHELTVQVARFGAGVEAQANMTRMLYEAAQRAEKNGGA
jgi:predicted nuclease with TOPRIM domain